MREEYQGKSYMKWGEALPWSRHALLLNCVGN